MLKKMLLPWLVILLTISNLLYAQSTDDAIRISDNQIGFGSRALGMGGAYVGVANDYSAIYWNPAGLAQMRKMEFWMGLDHVKFDNDIEYQGNSSTASANATKFGSIGLAFPVPTYRGSLVFALGYQRLRNFEYSNDFKGLSSLGSDRLSFELDSLGNIYDFYGKPVEKSEYIVDEGSINQWSAAGALDVSPNISMGLSLNFWTGKSDYQLDFTQFDRFNNFTMFPANFNDYLENRKLNTKYSSFNMTIGGLFRAGRLSRLGFTISLPHTFTVKEDYLTQSSISFDDGEIIYFGDEEGQFEYEVKIPFKFTGGMSVALGPILLSGAAEFMDWSQFKFDKPDEADLSLDYSDLLDQNKLFKENYRETLKWRLGGELGLPFYDSQVRAGFIYDPSPLKDADSKEDRKYITAGFGLLFDRIFKIDLAYLRGTWQQTTYDDLAPAGSREDITLQQVLATFAYRF